jgi:alcohol dehydrogenase (cytochrome c)
MAFDGEAEFFIRDEEYVEGDRFIGGGQQRVLPMERYTSAVRAIDPLTGDLRWEYPIQPQTWAGLLTTAGDLVFSGSVDGYFYALDAVTGRGLWQIAVGAQVRAAPMTFAVDGQQYVTIAAGNVVYTFGLDEN